MVIPNYNSSDEGTWKDDEEMNDSEGVGETDEDDI
tara:strand:- start:6357 stop:6461 length:105 start_codon:yes stop_codon:yes gene_type:complete